MKPRFRLARPAALALNLGIALLPLAFVLAYGVCVPIQDEWDHLGQLVQLRLGQLHFADVFARYNEHRLVVPRLLLYALDSLSGFDNRWAMRTSALLVALCIALLALARMPGRTRARDLFGMVPIALAFANLRQLDGLLWGWAVQAYVCLALAIGALVVLGSGAKRGRVLGSCALGLLACASWGAGIAVFPAALAQWWLAPVTPRNADDRERFVPIALGTASAIAALFLLWGLPHEAAAIPLEARLANLLLFLGSALGGTPALATLEGAGMLACALVLLLALASDRLRLRGDALGPGLLVFGLGAALLLAAGRTSGDWHDLLNARYVCILATVPAGLWITLIDLERAPRSRDGLALALAAGIGWGALTGAREAIALGPIRRSEHRLLAWFARTAALQPDGTLRQLAVDPASVRAGAAWMEKLRWSVWREDRAQPLPTSSESIRAGIDSLNGGPPAADARAVLLLEGDALFDVQGRALDANERRADVVLDIDGRRVPAFQPDDRESARAGRFRAQLWLGPLGVGRHRVQLFARAQDGAGEIAFAAPIAIEVR